MTNMTSEEELDLDDVTAQPTQLELDETCTVELGGQRFDLVALAMISRHYDGISRAKVQQWIEDGTCLLNGAASRSKQKVYAGDQLTLNVTLAAEGDWVAQEIPLVIVYEDEHLLVIDKPAGMVVHPAPGHADGTLVNAVLHHSEGQRLLPRAGIVHRLDKDTTGLMVVAKTLLAQSSLIEQLRTRSMGRHYYAICKGVPISAGKVDAPIGRDPSNRQRMGIVGGGKPAVTHYRVVARHNHCAELMLKLESGRTHQIRVHMQHAGFALVGDPLYMKMRGSWLRGMDPVLKQTLAEFPRQALHATELNLLHPATEEPMSWTSPIPDDLVALQKALRASDKAAKQASQI